MTQAHSVMLCRASRTQARYSQVLIVGEPRIIVVSLLRIWKYATNIVYCVIQDFIDAPFAPNSQLN